jgi:hypothetical protein
MSRRARCAALLICLLAGATEAKGGAGEEARGLGRSGWAALLTGYLVLTAATLGAAHMLRDGALGRSVAVGAGGWGGLGVGAAAGWGLARVGCDSSSSSEVVGCEDREGAGTVAGGLLGLAAATIGAFLVTEEPGLSRTYTAAAGMAPALLYFALGTILDL